MGLRAEEKYPGEWEIILGADSNVSYAFSGCIAKLCRRSGFDGVVYDFDLLYRLPDETNFNCYKRVLTADTTEDALRQGIEALHDDADSNIEEAKAKLKELEYKMGEADEEDEEADRDEAMTKTEASYDEWEACMYTFTSLKAACEKGDFTCRST